MATVFLRQTTVQNNLAIGNGIIFISIISYMSIISSTFSLNSVTVRGGVIFSDQDSIFQIFQSAFLNNSAVQGSAIYSQHCSKVSQITASTFAENTAVSSGCITSLESFISIDSSTICNNTAPERPAIEIIYYSQIIISNSIMKLHSGIASHIYVEESSVATVTNSVFSDSVSNFGYSVFKIRDSIFSCSNCSITNADSLGYTSIGCDNS